MESFQLSQDPFHLCSRQDHWQAIGTLRPDELGEISRFLPQDLFVQKIQGVEGLILCGGSHPLVHSQMG